MRQHQIARAKASIAKSNLETPLANNRLPIGCTVNVKLGVANHPEDLIKTWEAVLKASGTALTKTLIKYHTGVEQYHTEEAEKLVEQGYDTIVEPYSDTVPDVERDLNNTILDIRTEVDRLITSRTDRKRPADDKGKGPMKKPKNATTPPPKGGRQQRPYYYQRQHHQHKYVKQQPTTIIHTKDAEAYKKS